MRLECTTVALLLVAVSCKPKAPQTTAVPEPDTLALAERARADSIARAAAERARLDSIQVAEQHRADSLAALERNAQQMKEQLTARIYFDFDRSFIRPSDAQLMDQKLAVLQANPNARIQIAGNCDERGSDEYNLALGNRRAISARMYLVGHGIEPTRIEVVSYGEEKPLDPRHNETAWAMNRNDMFSLLTPEVVLQLPR